MSFIISTQWDGQLRKLYPTQCKNTNCNKIFYLPTHRYAKYCSRNCATELRKNKTECVCVLCRNIFYRRPSSLVKSKSGFYFCSRKCKDTAQQVGGILEIQPGHYKDGSTHYRDKALKYYGHKCMRCGYSKYPAILKVHHRDRNRTNNDIKNLEVLCPNCHEEEHYLSNDSFYPGTSLLKYKEKLVEHVGIEPT